MCASDGTSLEHGKNLVVSLGMQRESARPGVWSGVSLGPWGSPLALLFIGYFGEKCGNFKTGGSV